MLKYVYANVKTLNTPEYPSVLDLTCTFDEAIERKARYLKGQTAVPDEPSIEKLQNMLSDDNVTLSGLFKHEVTLTLISNPKLFVLWEQYKPDYKKIADKAIKNFETLRCFDTYPMDDLCYQILVSECVRLYFEDIYDHFAI